MCTVLHSVGGALLQSGLIADVIAGAGHLLTSLQVLPSYDVNHGEPC